MARGAILLLQPSFSCGPLCESTESLNLAVFFFGLTLSIEAQWFSTAPSARERVEVVKAVPARVTVGEFGVDQALADRRSGNRRIVRALLLGLFADHADRLVVVDGEDALVFLAQLLMAVVALGCTG
jgi:hypothetical protein